MPQKTSLLKFFKDFKENTKKHSPNLVFATLFTAIFAAIILTIFFGLYYFIMSKSSLSTFLAVRFTFLVINYLLVLILSSIVQIIVIKVFFEPELKLANLVGHVKDYFWKFLGLSIVINILFLLFCLPIYAALLLFAIENFILAIVSLITGILLILFFTAYVMFSPFILIEKKEKVYHALKQSMDMASGNLWGILSKLLILIVILIALNYIATLFINIPWVGQVFELAGIFLLFLVTFIYVFTLYENIKIKN
ncbi:MAG: hypothetical protein NTZ49_02625 [Candidatus Parcubacteria bacterium]|nr:hypothetical protein [Candidatus Parcubacteria bacterium]